MQYIYNILRVRVPVAPAERQNDNTQIYKLRLCFRLRVRVPVAPAERRNVDTRLRAAGGLQRHLLKHSKGCIHIYIYIHTHIHTHIHVYMHTHIYIYIYTRLFERDHLLGGLFYYYYYYYQY